MIDDNLLNYVFCVLMYFKTVNLIQMCTRCILQVFQLFETYRHGFLNKTPIVSNLHRIRRNDYVTTKILYRNKDIIFIYIYFYAIIFPTAMYQ